MSQEGQDDPLHTDTPPPQMPPETQEDKESPKTLNEDQETDNPVARLSDKNDKDSRKIEAVTEEAKLAEKINTAIGNEEERTVEEKQVKDDAGENGEMEHINGDSRSIHSSDDIPPPSLEDSARPRLTIRSVNHLSA